MRTDSLRASAVVLLTLCACDGYAQTGTVTPDVDHELIAALPRSAAGRAQADSAGSLVGIAGIHVSEIRLSGNTVLPEAEVASTLAAYEGRTVTVEELHELRQALSRTYFDKGFVNSGVVIPDQQVSDGVVRLDAVEGTLGEVDIQGNRALRQGYIERRVLGGVSEPLNIVSLQQNLRWLQDDPLIAGVNAELLPGEQRGSSQLRVSVRENPPWQLTLSADNYRPPSVAEERATLNLAHRSITGNGDTLSFRYGLTDGVDDFGAAYALPVSRKGTRLEGHYSKVDSEIIEAPFDRLDIRSNVEAFGVSVSHPFIRRNKLHVTGRLGFENKRSVSTLLGLPFSFSAGEIDGKAEASAAILAMEWMQRGAHGVFAARGTVSVGLDVLDPTIHEGSLADSRFALFLGQLNYVHTFPWRESQLVARSTFQLADSPLLAMYKLAVGGRYSVRGYRENLFVRDNAVTASIEYQVPLFVDDSGRSRFDLKIAPFVDWGRSWDKKDSLFIQGAESITGAGLGLLWNPLPGLAGEVYWGKDVDEQNFPNDTLQDRGIHLQILYQLTF